MKENNATHNLPVALVGILADDFTSAADGAGPFVARGYPALVSCGDDLDLSKGLGQVLGQNLENALSTHSREAGVCALDLGSRLLSGVAAADVTAAALAKLQDCYLVFKTIDSTLRGNIRSELKAVIDFVLASEKYDRVVIAPAFPEAGRVTKGGIQFVDGIPVSQSSYGRDPVHPATISRIRDLISLPEGEVVVVSDPVGFEEKINALMTETNKVSVLILDAERQEDLDWQVAQFPNPEQVLWVGSPGLACALSGLIPMLQTETLWGDCARQSSSKEKVKRALILVGSANPISREQCEHLAVSGVPVLERVEDLHNPEDFETVCLRVPTKRHPNPEQVRDKLIEEARALMRSIPFDIVIATGGETMVAFMAAIGIEGLSLGGELEPGFPFGEAIPTRGGVPGANREKDVGNLILAMKAGGFGSRTTLFDAVKKLRPLSVMKGPSQ